MEQEFKLSKKEVLNLFDIKESTFYKWVKKGKLNYIDENGRRFVKLNQKEIETLRNNLQSIRESYTRNIDVPDPVKDVEILHNSTSHSTSADVDNDRIIQPEVYSYTDNDVEEVYRNDSMDKLVECFRDFTNQLNNVHEGYRTELQNMHKKVALLEDSESRTKESYQQLHAENTQLKRQLDDKEQQLKNLEIELISRKQNFLTTPVSVLLRKL